MVARGYLDFELLPDLPMGAELPLGFEPEADADFLSVVGGAVFLSSALALELPEFLVSAMVCSFKG